MHCDKFRRRCKSRLDDAMTAIIVIILCAVGIVVAVGTALVDWDDVE